jgi:hypothetical protein
MGEFWIIAYKIANRDCLLDNLRAPYQLYSGQWAASVSGIIGGWFSIAMSDMIAASCMQRLVRPLPSLSTLHIAAETGVTQKVVFYGDLFVIFLHWQQIVRL